MHKRTQIYSCLPFKGERLLGISEGNIHATTFIVSVAQSQVLRESDRIYAIHEENIFGRRAKQRSASILTGKIKNNN